MVVLVELRLVVSTYLLMLLGILYLIFQLLHLLQVYFLKRVHLSILLMQILFLISCQQVIDRLFLFCALAVANLADVAVKTEADVVDEGIFLSVNAHEGEIFYVFCELEGRGAALKPKIVEKVIAASGTEVEYFLFDV